LRIADCGFIARARVAAETIQHQFHHVALAMVRRRDVGEYEEFHALGV
jgi:hypothetical protein